MNLGSASGICRLLLGQWAIDWFRPRAVATDSTANCANGGPTNSDAESDDELPDAVNPELPTLERFLDLLRGSQLLTAENLARVEQLPEREEFQDPASVAWWLVEQTLVTRWQARMLISGRNRFFLGKYKLLDRIGAGGMGTVYKARQSGLAREVALKVLSESLVDNERAAARFHREIQSAAALTHPNIVTTLDADCVAGKHFLVMEYVNGENLETLARRRGPLPVAEACEYIRQAALGLAHAHGRGMIHRDIKPANLLVLKSPSTAPQAADSEPDKPVVKILDFGLARLTTEKQGDTELTQTGQVLGTPDYIAPEQARDTHLADCRSDVYSLGGALFRLLTGRVPFVRQSVMEKLMARALEEAPRARSIRLDLPIALDECIARMLAREPDGRYQTALEVAEALHEILASVAGIAIAAPQRAAGDTAAQPGAAALFTPVAAHDSELEQFLAVLAHQADSGSSAGGAPGDTDRAAVEPGATQTVRARPAKPAAERAGPQKRRTRAMAAASRWSAANPVAVAVACCVPLAALVVWYLLGGVRLDIDWPLDERQGATLAVDGREPILAGKLSFSGRPGKRKLKMMRNGYRPIEEEIQLERGEVATYRPVWTPTPQTLRRQQWTGLKAEAESLVASQRGAGSGDWTTIQPLRIRLDEFRRNWLTTREAEQAAAMLRRLPAPADRLSRVQITPNEMRISGLGEPAHAPPELVAVFGDSRWKHCSLIDALAWSPDDSIIAAADNLGNLLLWDAQTGEEIAGARIGEHAEVSLAFSPDGKFLITGSGDNLGRIWEISDLHVVHTLRGHSNQIRSMAYSPDGNFVASGSIDGSVRIWNAADGSLVRELREGVEQVACTAFSPDGKMLAVGCHTPFAVAIFDMETGRLAATLDGHTSGVLTLAFNREGTQLISSGHDGTCRCWDVTSWKELRTFPAGDGRNRVTAIRFIPDGKTIACVTGSAHIDLHDAESGAHRGILKCDDSGVTCMSYRHDGKRIATGGAAHAIRVYDLQTRAEAAGPAPAALCLAPSPDGRLLALGMDNGAIDLWDLATGEKQATLKGTARRVGKIAFCPTGLLLATAGDTGDSAVRVWDVARREIRHVLSGHWDAAWGLAFSPDGLTLATTSNDGAVRLWNVTTGDLLQTLEGAPPPPICAAFSYDGKTLVVGHNHGPVPSIRFWDVSRGKERKPLSVEWNEVTGVAFAPDGSLVAGYRNQGVKLWSELRGGPRGSFAGRGTFAISPDGKRLAVDEKTGIYVYDLARGAQIASLPFGRPGCASLQLAFTAESRHLAVLGSDGTVRVMRLPSDEAE